MEPSEKLLKKLGYFHSKYNKYRQKVNCEGEHYNFSSLMSTVLSVLLVFYSHQFFNNLILLDIIFMIM